MVNPFTRDSSECSTRWLDKEVMLGKEFIEANLPVAPEKLVTLGIMGPVKHHGNNVPRGVLDRDP